MTRHDFSHPTATQLAEAMARGRRERAEAFKSGLRALGSFISGGRPQAR